MQKEFLVSGGSGGIGTAVCRLLAMDGHRPIVGYHRNADAAENLARELGSLAVQLDLADQDSIAAAVKELKRETENVSGIIFAASPPPLIGPFGRITDEEMNHQWSVNVAGPRKLLGELLRNFFRERQSGYALAVLTSAMGESGRPASGNMGGYVISKFGLKGVLVAAQAEFPWMKIGFVYPSFTDTPMLRIFDKRFLDGVRAQEPNGRFSTPEEVASTIVELIKDSE